MPQPASLGRTKFSTTLWCRSDLLPLLAATYALHFTGQGHDQSLPREPKANEQHSCSRLETRVLVPKSSMLAPTFLQTFTPPAALSRLSLLPPLPKVLRSAVAHVVATATPHSPVLAAGTPIICPPSLGKATTTCSPSKSAATYSSQPVPFSQGKAGDNDTTRILSEFIRRRDIGAAFDVIGSDEDLVAAFAWRVSFLTFEALRHRDEDKQSWNSLLVDFWRLSTAHAQYMVVKNFHEALKDPNTTKSVDSNTVSLLHKLFRLYALHTLEKEASEFYSSAAVTVRQITLARTKAVMKLLEEIRPHAVRLVDAWKFPDWQLDSSSGPIRRKSLRRHVLPRKRVESSERRSSSTLTRIQKSCSGRMRDRT